MAKQPIQDNAPEDPEKKAEDEALDEELEETFPASDPPASTAPGRGVTGAEVKREKK